jgi:hypothetical protein
MRDICLARYSPAASGRMVAAIPMSTCPLRGHESDSGYETQARSTRALPNNERAACLFALRKAAVAIGRVKDHAGTYPSLS